MDFQAMGVSDFNSDVDKHGNKGELKMVSVRLNENFSDFLTELSSCVGMSRQPFLSAIIENYYFEAIIDYISGYVAHMPDYDIERFFDVIDKDTVDYENFRKRLDKELSRLSVMSNAYNSYDGKDKKEHFENYIKPELDARFDTSGLVSNFSFADDKEDGEK